MELRREIDLDKLIIPVLSLALLWACQHTELKAKDAIAANDMNCRTKPFTLEIAENQPIFAEEKLPKGTLIFDNARVYVEKLDNRGDVQQKVHVSESFESAQRENLLVRVHCMDNKKVATNFEASIPAIKKIEISPNGNRLESKDIILKMINGKLDFSSKNPTPPTGTTTLKDFFDKFDVKYAFYKINRDTYELRGFRSKDGVNSYLAVQYHLVLFE